MAVVLLGALCTAAASALQQWEITALQNCLLAGASVNSAISSLPWKLLLLIAVLTEATVQGWSAEQGEKERC